MTKKCIVIGLDGATFDIINHMIKEGELPTFKKIMNEGCYGTLKSTPVPMSASAWSSFITGMSPGGHRIFGFFKPLKNDYRVTVTNSTDRKGIEIWDALKKSGKTCGAVNIPLTYPAKNINGFMISGYPSPKINEKSVKPKALLERLQKHLGDFSTQPQVFWSKENEEEYLKDCYRRWDIEEKMYHLLKKEECDVFIFVFRITDDLLHGLWKCIDSSHPFHDAKAGALKDKVLEVYRRADNVLSDVIGRMDSDTILIVMSDHGFGPVHSTVYLNNWLMKMGYLNLKDDFVTKFKFLLHKRGFNAANIFLMARKLGVENLIIKKAFSPMKNTRKTAGKLLLSFYDVDWSKTKAYCRGGSGEIYVNMKGREPSGIVEEGEYEELVKELISKLSDLRDPRNNNQMFGEPVAGRDVFQGGYKNECADILFTDLEYITMAFPEFVSNKLVTESLLYRSGDHRPYGIFMAYGRDIAPGELKNANIMDIAPTILYYTGSKIPKEMHGRVLKGVFSSAILKKEERFEEIEEKKKESAISEEEEEEKMERLRNLGYA
jgi:predicted AlkP superfamily phosphohydrolase/phosphomutase